MLFEPQPAHKSLAGQKLADVLRLIRTPNIGPVTFFALLRRYGSAAEALACLPQLARDGGRRSPLIPAPQAGIEQEIERTHAHGARFVMYGEEDYPALLLTVPDAPPVLTLLGDASLWRRPCLAVVGARSASAGGCQLAHSFARELGASGFTIVSGLARGIDAHAHKGALATGTVGVIAGGIDTVYPPENLALYAHLRERGAIICEQPFGMLPFAGSFPGRNRIIAGMSQATLVVEAAPQSGSLITARLAGEYNRDLFAIPGSPLDPRARGCNQLIRDGAAMAESAADIVHALAGTRVQVMREAPAPAFTPAPTQAAPAHNAPALRAQVIEKLGPTPVLVDELIEQCETSAHHVLTVLLELELAGRLRRSAGNKVYLTQKREEVA